MNSQQHNEYPPTKGLALRPPLSRRYFILITCIYYVTAISLGHAQQTTPQSLNIRYAYVNTPSHNVDQKENYKIERYFYELLKLAIKKSDKKYHIQPISTEVMVNERKNLLIQNRDLDIHWLPTDSHFENELLPIRLPLLKGLIGWRLMLVHKDNAKKMAKITKIEELQQWVAGQGSDWADTDILEFNKFTVARITQKNSIMGMLERQRIDYYPRSMTEIWSDLEYFTVPNVVIDNSLALSYPLAVYYFVRKGNTQLHDLIYQGLDNAIEDGSFDHLFETFFAEAIAKADLKSRKIYYLKNPFLNELTPLKDKRLWYRPLE